MNASSTVQERIFQAADALYAEADQQTFPTVDAVRKAAKVNMNDASTGMKAWRKAQTAQVASVTVQIPGTLQQAGASALASLWSEAMTLASETLRAAEAGWSSERVEAEALREQIANAFEAQAAEFESLRTIVSDLYVQLDQVRNDKANLQKQLDDALRARDDALATTCQSEARTIEIQHRADDLRTELDYAHMSLTSLNEEMAAQRREQQTQIANLRTEAEALKTLSEARLAAARSDLAKSREEVALLLGTIDGIQQKSPSGKARGRLKTESAEA